MLSGRTVLPPARVSCTNSRSSATVGQVSVQGLTELLRYRRFSRSLLPVTSALTTVTVIDDWS